MDTVLKLRELRHLRGLSQKAVARLSGVGEKTLSSFETGERSGSLKLSQLAKLLRIYDVTEAEFFGQQLEELFDPDAITTRSREQALIQDLAAPPKDVRRTLLDSFDLMLEAARKIHVHAAPAIRLVGDRSRTPAAA